MTAQQPAPRPTLPRLLTHTEVAGMLAMTPDALRQLRSRGGGPPVVRLGATVRYRPRDVVEYIDAHVQQPTRTRKEKRS